MLVVDIKSTAGAYSKSGSFFHHFVANNRYPYARHVCKPTRLQGCRWRWCCRAPASTSSMSGRWGWHCYSRLVAAGGHTPYIMFIKFQRHRHCIICRYRSWGNINEHISFRTKNPIWALRSETKPGPQRTFYLPKIYTVLKAMVMVQWTNLRWT